MVGAVLGVRPHRALPALRGAEGKDILSLPTKYNNKINLFLSAVIHTPHPYPCARPLEMPTQGVTPPWTEQGQAQHPAPGTWGTCGDRERGRGPRGTCRAAAACPRAASKGQRQAKLLAKLGEKQHLSLLQLCVCRFQGKF